tara:strand:- start:2164 stop:2712 length:549 start_codon:yes stop_codon:yes gene_type:complete
MKNISDFCGYDYKSLIYFENVIKKLKIPKTGKIVQLGSNFCVTLEKMCNFYGYKRCIGYDLVNPLNHPNVIIKDCAKLGKDKKRDYFKIAYCDIDLSSLHISPKLRISAIKWVANQIIKNGYILTNNSWAFKKHSNFDVESFMKENNFQIIQLDKYKNQKWAKIFNKKSKWNTKSAMICKKL